MSEQTFKGPGRYALFADGLPDPGEEARTAIDSLYVSVSLAGRTANIDLRALSDRRALAHSFAAAIWAACQVGGPAGTCSTARYYGGTLRTFWRYLRERRHDVQRVDHVDVAAIDGFDQWMVDREAHPNARVNRMTMFVSLMRIVALLEPRCVSDETKSRLRYPSLRQGVPCRPRDAYSDYVTAALRDAARRDFQVIRARLSSPAPLVPTGDKLIDSEAAALAVIDDQGTIRYRHAAFLRYRRFNQLAGGTGALLTKLHSQRHLIMEDIVPLLVLLSLDTGVEIECLLDLKVDCLKNPSGGYVELEYCKRRARGSEWKRVRVRDEASSTPGGMIRLVVGWTDAARKHGGYDTLWAHFHRKFGQLAARPLTLSTFASSWAQRHDLVDDNQHPLRLDMTRLRKTHKAAWYKRTAGQMRRFAVGHSIEVAADHYADIPALRPIHEATLAAAFTDALEAALQPLVLTPAAEVEALAGRAEGIPVAPDEIAPLLSGEQDVWLASCGGFYRSPYGSEGAACPVPFWGCLECRNAVITVRKLPALLAFEAFMVGQRAVLLDGDWQIKFSRPYRRIVEQILPRFSAVEVEAARGVAGATADLIYLPPEAGLM
ncbi:hypothetical protein [Tardiphaga sp.]|uniref:hypothetical protein n=1 Tax=Tardiphaga sp. TaxID=1926292 RepID=UPI00352B9313